MQHPSLDTIATRLLEPLRREQEILNRTIVQQVAQGTPVKKAMLAAALHLSPEELEQRLTLVPTVHQFRVEQRTLFAWCAFDTLTYPVELHLSAQVTSRCPVTGSSIHLTVTPDQLRDLEPEEAHISLVVDVAAECGQNVREDVCSYGHFFASHEAATQWQAEHPQVLILSVEEAYQVGKLV
jgi:alkylmercury lyase